MTNLSDQLCDISYGHPFALGYRADLLNAVMFSYGRPVVVAVKALRGVSLYDTVQTQNLRAGIEARLPHWEALSHVNICPVYGLTYDYPFTAALVLPYFPNGNVMNYIKSHTNADIYGLITGIADGLCYLHSQAMVHGDLRVSNVLVDNEGNARLADFGLSDVLSRIETATTDVAEHARYQAPEIFLAEDGNQVLFTFKTDIFSFSMLGVAILTKDLPFNHRKYDTSVILDIANGLRPRKPASNQLVEKLWPIFERCWAQDPPLRPSMQAVSERLHQP